MSNQRLLEIAARLDHLTAALEKTPITPEGAIIGNVICAQMDELFDEVASLGIE